MRTYKCAQNLDLNQLPLTDSITVHTVHKHLQPRVCTDNGDRPISIDGISVLVDGMNE